MVRIPFVPWNNGSEALEAADRHNRIGDFSHIDTNLTRLQKITDYCTNHNVDALVLLAGYSNKEIDIPVLSIYGSNDKALNMDTYNDSKVYYKNFTEHIIQGGNHAQFANYGPQKGDGEATINSTQQQNETANEIIKFIDLIF